MKKSLFIFATFVGLTLTSCTGDEFTDSSPTKTTNGENGETPIVFSSLNQGMTRADYTGKDAATKLGNKFVVTAYKGPKSLWDATNSKITMDNYFVEYVENTAHTTESNVANWEYAGKPRTQHAIDKGITSQTVKYWDYSAPQYDFIAWSAGPNTALYSGSPSADNVVVSAITPETATGSGATGAYTFTGTAEDLQECYISDLVTVKKAQYGTSPVTMKFRQLGTKVRIGIYETIPGYSVKNVKFYNAAASALLDESDATSGAANTAKNNKAKLFTTTTNNIYTSGTYYVKFPDVDDDSKDYNNQAHVSFVPNSSQATSVEWGALNYTYPEDGERTYASVYLGRKSNEVSYAGDPAKNYYEVFLPNEEGTNLNLRVNYTLEAIDGGGETIEVKGATAQIPSIYATWKPGFAYTYIFKISDKTNGHTGTYDPLKPDDTSVNSDPAGLYPITFDAMVENAEDHEGQETITTVSTPSITTYQKGSTVINNDEYKAATGDIFVTVNDGTTADTPDLAHGDLQDLTGKATLYIIDNGKTEADVVDALSIRDDHPADGVTILGRNGMELREQTLTLTDKIEYGVDGNVIDLSGSTKRVARFTPTAPVAPATLVTYAFVYTKSPIYYTTDRYEAVTKAAGADVTNLYRNFNLTSVTGDAQKGYVYMSFNTTTGILTQETSFLGQRLNYYYYVISSGAGTTEDPYVYTSLGGYAQTGTAYYYTTDGGTTFKAAVNIAYADFATATDLYTYDGTSYSPKTGATPADYTTYYKRTGTGTTEDPYVYTRCVMLPQQVNGWYRYQFFADGRYHCMNGEKAIADHGYYDKYTQNDGVYYTKVIKVQ